MSPRDPKEESDTIRFAIPYIIPLNKTLSESEALLINLERKKHKTLLLPINTHQHYNNNSELLVCLQANITSTYGIHDDAGHPFYGTVLNRGSWKNNDITFPRGKPKSISQSNKNSHSFYDSGFFISYLQFHNFGHMLTETVSSIHPLLLWKQRNSINSEIPIFINEPLSSDEHQVQALLELLEIPKQQVIRIGENSNRAKVGRLFMASPTHVNRNFASKSHSMWVKTYLHLSKQTKKETTKTVKISKKVYISRSNLSPLVRQLDMERELEKLLSLDGWLIFHPEEHSIDVQIKIYEACEQICGLEGSAIHLLFGITTEKLKHFILLCQNKKNNFTTQFDAQSIRYIAIDCLELDTKCAKAKTTQNIRAKEGINASKLFQFIRYPLKYQIFRAIYWVKSFRKFNRKA